MGNFSLKLHMTYLGIVCGASFNNVTRDEGLKLRLQENHVLVRWRGGGETKAGKLYNSRALLRVRTLSRVVNVNRAQSVGTSGVRS